MAVRICHLEREDRGNAIARVRLVGHASEQAFPGQEQSGSVDPLAAARWIREQLGQIRDGSSVSMLSLDTEGSACSWITSPSTDQAVINVVARHGSAASGDEGPRGNAAVEFYAPAANDSSVEPLSAVASGQSGLRTSFRKPAKPAAETPQRMAILAIADVPGRMLIDALDELGIAVDAACSFWHLAASAWDPNAARAASVAAESGPLQAQTVAGTAATIVIDPRGKLIWCWSRAGELLVSGSMRLRVASPMAAAVTDEPPVSEPARVVFGADEVNRLVAEWLSWSMQTGLSPSHVTCVMTEHDPEMVAEFGQALGRLWPNTTIDAVMMADPIAATLSRAAERLESTPRAAAASLTPRSSLVGLSTRHGRAHRQMYVWGSLAVAGAAVIATSISLRLQNLATQARGEAATVAGESDKLVKEHFPDARRGPGYSLLQATTDEVLRLRNLAEPPKRAEPPMPLLEELETISMVTGNANYALETIDLESSSSAILKLGIVANSLSEAEAMTEALNSIAGSGVLRWEEPSQYDTNSRPGKFRINYTARWAPRVEKKAEKP